jgi:hypothetical protein
VELTLKMDMDAPEGIHELVIDLRDAMAGPEGIQPGGLCVTASTLLAARLARDGRPAWVILSQYAPVADATTDYAHAYVRCGAWGLDATREQFAHVSDCGEADDHTLLVFRAGTQDEHYRAWAGGYRARPAWDFEVVEHLRDADHPAAVVSEWLQAVGLQDLERAVLVDSPPADEVCWCCFEPSAVRVTFADSENPRAVRLCGRHSDQLRAAQRSAAPVGRNDACLCGSGRKYKRCCGGA